MACSQEQFRTLFAYHWHTNQRLLAQAAQLSDADYTAHPGYGHGSLHDLFFHILRADQGWRTALETGQQQPPLNAADYSTLVALQAGFAQEQGTWQTLLEQFTAEQIEAPLTLTTRRGATMQIPLWRVLQHVVLHGMQHHTEIAQLLTAKQHSPGDIDFIFYING